MTTMKIEFEVLRVEENKGVVPSYDKAGESSELLLPLVSILVPIYDVADYIERCVTSLFNQTYQNLEFLFVDDCSPDNSVEILNCVVQRFPARIPQVRILYHETNRGLSAVRNTLVANAKGTFVYHIDSDDWLEPDAIELLVKRQQETGATVVSGRHYCHKNGSQLSFYKDGFGLKKEELIKGIAERRIVENVWNRLIPKRLYTDHQIAGDETIKREDHLPSICLLFYAEQLEIVDKRIYHHDDDNKRSIMAKTWHNWDSIEERFVMVKHVWDYFSEKEPEYGDLFANYYYVCIHQHLLKAVNDKAIFRKIVNYLQSTDSSYWYLIGWDNPFNRFVDSHLSLLKARLRFVDS